MTVEDQIKYAAACADVTCEWALTECGDCENEHDTAVNAISDALLELLSAVHRLPDRHRYSDGRVIVSRVEVEYGLIAQHIWKPGNEDPQSWRSDLPHDPGTPPRGKYEVTTDPVTQQMHVRVLGGVS